MKYQLFQLRPQNVDQGKYHADPRACHRFLYSLFVSEQLEKPTLDTPRPFLWRRLDQSQAIVVLSAYDIKKPASQLRGYDYDPPKSFDPQLEPGDCLHFTLRANPVVRSWMPRKPNTEDYRRVRHDVVMYDLWRQDPNNPDPEDTPAKIEVIQREGFKWLKQRSERLGFEIEAGQVQVDGYRQIKMMANKEQGSRGYTLSTIDYDGVLTVTDPDRFRHTVTQGIGPAKAYGCGLMLVKRAA